MDWNPVKLPCNSHWWDYFYCKPYNECTHRGLYWLEWIPRIWIKTGGRWVLSNSEIELCKLTANVYEPLSQTIKKCRKLNEVHPLIFSSFSETLWSWVTEPTRWPWRKQRLNFVHKPSKYLAILSALWRLVFNLNVSPNYIILWIISLFPKEY